MNTITIRVAAEDDYEAILELFREFAHFENLDERMTNSVERMKAEKNYFNCFVAVSEQNEIVGYATHFFAYFTCPQYASVCLWIKNLILIAYHGFFLWRRNIFL